MKVFQNNLFLSWDILVNITYLYAKMQSNIFVAYFCNFELFSCLLPFFQVINQWKFDWLKIDVYFKYAYMKEH